ncbi:anti-sigma factor antagonist [Streptomyces sp. TRM66268-LWL]|uniref:Anti-sigma factor antagonist n=1 Tax=Streptomyces polyasparticus TaxID=2767826 RepID=A0ABR7SWQ1_9ACTN|nr:anti-sigma factor antagonist [Streptomyces polyasparticus]MBC9719080.1 anti-sigma factor antagonist [Streptomyces polyasparticus]
MHELRDHPVFSCSEHTVCDTTVVEVRGALDILTIPSLNALVDRLTAATDRPDLVLDLRAVSFIDCSGLGALCRARTRVNSRQGRLLLVSADAWFLRILRCTGLARSFDVHAGPPYLQDDACPAHSYHFAAL